MSKTKPSSLGQYEEAGLPLIPLHRWDRKTAKGKELGKAPIDANWPETSYGFAEMRLHMEEGKNVGARLGGGWAVLDIDPRNGGTASLKRLTEFYKMNLKNYGHVITGRGDGGMHIYVRLPDGYRGRAKTEELPGVDFKHHPGMQVVAAGSVHPETQGVYSWGSTPLQNTDPIPDAVLKLFEVKRPPAALQGEGDQTFNCIGPEQIKVSLSALDPADFRDHEEWLALMMSVHWLSGGQARTEWVNWSTGDELFADDGEQIEYRWDSLSSEGGFAKRVVKGGFLYKCLFDRGLGQYAPRISASRDFSEINDEDLVGDSVQDLSEEAKTLKTMNDRHAVVSLAGSSFITRRTLRQDTKGRSLGTIEYCLPRDMRLMYQNKHLTHTVPTASGEATKRTNWFDFWVEHPSRREYESVTFAPESPPVIQNPDGSQTLNLWEGFAMDPENPGNGDWGLLDRMILEAVCNGDHQLYKYVLDWIAYSYQHRARPQGVALVMRGPKGVGKGTLARAWLEPWGLHGAATDDGEDIFGRFNAALEYKCGIFLDEAFWAGDRSIGAKIKARITEPQIRIEQKHQPQRWANNNLKIMIASNDEFVVPATTGERRFVIVDVNRAFKGDHQFWEDLNHQMDNGGIQAFFHDMMKRPLGKWRPEANRIITDAEREQARYSLGEIADWWIDLLHRAELPDQIGDWARSPVWVPVGSLRDHFDTHLGSRRGDWAFQFEQRFSWRLRDAIGSGSLQIKKIRLPDTEEFMHLPRLGDGRTRCFQIPSLQACRKVACEMFGKSLFDDEEQDDGEDFDPMDLI